MSAALISIGANQYALESLAEFQIEDGVDDGINEGIHVTEPSGQQEGCYSRLTLPLQLQTDGVHDVAREEWHPADQEHTCHCTLNALFPDNLFL